MDAAVIIVGDEILSGHVRDANAHFISSRLSALGHRLRRISIVGDEPQGIAEVVVREAEAPDVGIVFICGGLGPTHDDRTMEALAQALGLPLVPCPPMAERIEGIAERMRGEGFAGDPLGLEGLRKMALAPEGAQMLECSSGWVPAVALDYGGRPVVVLPGPPRQVEMVFHDAVEPLYLAETGVRMHREEVEHNFPESALAATLVELEEQLPQIRIGSYPLDDRVLIRIAGDEGSARKAAAILRERIEELERSDDGKRLLEFFHKRRRPR
jgi:molybdenum cofactor synthesis domain-containing protein